METIKKERYYAVSQHSKRSYRIDGGINAPLDVIVFASAEYRDDYVAHCAGFAAAIDEKTAELINRQGDRRQ